MRLIDLEADWMMLEGRIIGVTFLCPCEACKGNGCTIGVLFRNPPDGGPSAPDNEDTIANYSGRRWTRTGDTLGTLSITPSIDASASGHWHGFVTNGVAT